MKNILRKMKPAARVLFVMSVGVYCAPEYFCNDPHEYDLPECTCFY